MARKHNLDEVLNSLSKKKDCKIFHQNQLIEILAGGSGNGEAHALGNGSWGKLDYLIKCSNYRYVFVNEFSKF